MQRYLLCGGLSVGVIPVHLHIGPEQWRAPGCRFLSGSFMFVSLKQGQLSLLFLWPQGRGEVFSELIFRYDVVQTSLHEDGDLIAVCLLHQCSDPGE